MFLIQSRENLTPSVVKMEIAAPMVARRCKAGQFVILRAAETGERIPLTIADYDRQRQTVTIIFQVVGKSTRLLAEKQQGDCIPDFAGPLGKPSELEGIRRAAVVGGGLGCAIAHPQAKELFESGAQVDLIAGFRSKEFVILEEAMKKVSNRLFIMTDDGSYGEKGLVTDRLRSLIESGGDYDAVIAIGPLVMMKYVSLLTKEFGIKTIVSMNPIMIDGTGMCGGCRLTVGGETKFACVDGPDFDGHLVDFDEAIRRAGMYRNQERQSAENHACRMDGMR